MEYRVKTYQITIDGPAYIHDKQRVLANGHKTYDVIINNLIAISKVKRKDFRIYIRTNFTSEIYDCIDEYINKMAELFGEDERFVFSFYSVKDVDCKVGEVIKDKIVNNYANPMKMIYTSLLNHNKSLNLSLDNLEPGNSLCYAGKHNNYVITSNGELHKCTIDLQDKDTSVASIVNHSIVNNDNYCKYLSRFNACPNLYDCSFAPVCTGIGCPKHAVHTCSFIYKNLDLVLLIHDKNKKIKSIEKG